MSDFREFLLETLPKSAHKKVDEIMAEFGMYVVDIEAVHVGQHPLVCVETVTAYGLEIELDAHGQATLIHFPDGACIA